MRIINRYAAVLAATASLALAACGPGDDASAFTPATPPPANSAPTITGSPPTSVTAGTPYYFEPDADDEDRDSLHFTATGLPGWATFNTQSGALSGTPSNAGTTTNIVISVSDGKASASLPVFQINVINVPPPPPPPNSAPTISGTPPTSVVAGSFYSFTPGFNDTDGDTLAFSISNKPVWATFSTATGSLSGTPTTGQAGTYMNIVISVSDGKSSATLAAFAITVTLPPPTGTATLSWTAPTQNTDGSQLTDLAGYRVYHGTRADSLTDVVQLPGTANTGYVYNQLAIGTHYFAVAAYNNSGVESALSGVGSKAIP